ncbi:hypothetical protein, partial [Salmonella enterica]|uniref:hypothetical protein n=1 Tax=Salmonella enterica TaxID=28901 RepID=UPI001BAE6827
ELNVSEGIFRFRPDITEAMSYMSPSHPLLVQLCNWKFFLHSGAGVYRPERYGPFLSYEKLSIRKNNFPCFDFSPVVTLATSM